MTTEFMVSGGDEAEAVMATVAGSGVADEAGPHTHEPERDRAAPSVPPSKHPSTAVLADAGDLLRALAAPVRIAIVLQLREADRCVHELVDALDVAQPLISQHLRVLKTAGVVQGERRGREVVYRLADDHLAHIVVDAVDHVQEGKQ
ncbi:metalloregulator ArsR/SmtB family transcription factor [Amycolatopsis sp., V23-08]|uniref:Metalloregulator ArsR/SmtB family transcription factor n=1 Tax=Amycolatopsis heterodermiae TaxID=3110235 RepID=A0ABU5RJS3_9PSEU|nr:metalloregulator ArsR/SmtB family transcription factor [Amycolatopsis sp., V23-08]MEA5366540.1 metalloregulator ArsR/SmtB family transcription factor [Amycolatopsis sp., V23-08]